MTGPAFRTWLSSELDRQGMKRRELARRLASKHPEGLNTKTMESARRAIYKYLSGESTPTDPTRNAIADALGVDPSSIPSDDDEEESDLVALLTDLAREHAELSRRLFRALKEANAA